jgi:arginine N-succinyltransferase
MLIKSREFIPKILPTHPIYTCLLSPETRKVIGEAQENSKPALHLLETEGFTKTSLIDIFDGGPIISCPRNSIRSIRDSCFATVEKIVAQPPESVPYLVTNNSLDFRACQATLGMKGSNLTIDEKVAQALNVKIGDTLRYVTAHPES